MCGYCESPAGADGLTSCISVLLPQFLWQYFMDLSQNASCCIDKIFVTGCIQFVKLITFGATNGVNFVKMTALIFSVLHFWPLVRNMLWFVRTWKIVWGSYILVCYVKCQARFLGLDGLCGNQTRPFTANPNMSNLGFNRFWTEVPRRHMMISQQRSKVGLYEKQCTFVDFYHNSPKREGLYYPAHLQSWFIFDWIILDIRQHNVT